MDHSKIISMMEHFKLPEAAFNFQVSDSHIEEISNSFCEKWRSLPPYLEMKTIVAKDIDRDHTGCDECEKRCSFLKKWKKLKGLKATYRGLIHALLEIKCTEEAEGVCKLLKNQNSTDPPQDGPDILPSPSIPKTSNVISELSLNPNPVYYQPGAEEIIGLNSPSSKAHAAQGQGLFTAIISKPTVL